MTDAELSAAALAQTRVIVREKGGGVVKKYSPEYVWIAGVYYSREIYVFTRK